MATFCFNESEQKLWKNEATLWPRLSNAETKILPKSIKDRRPRFVQAWQVCLIKSGMQTLVLAHWANNKMSIWGGDNHSFFRRTANISTIWIWIALWKDYEKSNRAQTIKLFKNVTGYFCNQIQLFCVLSPKIESNYFQTFIMAGKKLQ